MSSQWKRDIHTAFGGIVAEDSLKQATMERLSKKMHTRARRGSPMQAVALAACLAVFAVVALSMLYHAQRQYYIEDAYIALDVNPSVGLSINRYNRVIEVYPYNAEGRKVITGLTLLHSNYEEAVAALMDAMSRQGYLTDDGLVAVSLQSAIPEKEAALRSSLQADVDTFVTRQAVDAKSEIIPVDSDIKTHAHAQGLTPAKYLAILELQEVDPAATVSECRGHSIGEIRRQTREHAGHGGAGEADDAADDMEAGMGNGHGHHGGW